MTAILMAACYDQTTRDDDAGTPATPYIVAACDTLFSTETSSNANVPLGKIQKLGFLDNWLIGFAGSAEHFIPARGFVRHTLDEIRYGVDPKTITDEQITDKLAKGYMVYRRRCIERECMARCDDMTLAEFRQHGQQRYGEYEYNRLNKSFSEYELKLDLLVAGFNQHNSPVIGRIENPGLWRNRPERYEAVGSGADLAIGYLDATGFGPYAPVEHIMYRILEAKIFSEAAPLVGTGTFLIRMNSKGVCQRVADEDCAAFGALWRKRRAEYARPLLKLVSRAYEFYNY